MEDERQCSARCIVARIEQRYGDAGDFFSGKLNENSFGRLLIVLGVPSAGQGTDVRAHFCN